MVEQNRPDEIISRDDDEFLHGVLNRLPRHVGQARAIDDFLDVSTVIQLECSSETIQVNAEMTPEHVWESLQQRR